MASNQNASDRRRANREALRATAPLGRTWRNNGGRLVGISAVLLSAVLLVAPTAAGVAPAKVVKHIAPFHGTVHIGQVILSSGCGASASFVVPPKFSLKTGIGLISSKSSAKGCGPPGFPDYGATEGITGFDSKAFTWVAGMGPNVTYNVSVSVVDNLTATPMNPFGGPFAWASAYVFVQAGLWDLTTASQADSAIIVSLGDSTNSSVTGYVNHSWVIPGLFSFAPANFTGGHQYIVQIFVTALEFTYAPSSSSTSATARLNMATGGRQFTVGFWELS